MLKKQNSIDAETVALDALAFMASDSTLLSRFVANSGIGPDDLRARAAEPAVLCAVLDFVLGDDETALAASAALGIEPQALHLARHKLGRGT